MKFWTIKLRAILVFFFFSIPFTNGFAQHEKQVELFCSNPNFKHASIGFCIKDYEGNIVASHNPEKSYTPASILKVITTASALEILGSNYQYETLLKVDNSTQPTTLTIIGSGDPTLGTEHLNNTPREFIETWTNKVSTTLADQKNKLLNIYIKDDLFGYDGVSRKWIYEDMGNYYAAAAYGISVFDNTYRLSFNTEDSKSPPILTATTPKMKDINFINALSLNSTGRDNGYIVGAPFSNKRMIIGDIPSGRKKFTIKGAIPDPAKFLGETIANNLTTRGIRIGKIETSRESYYDNIYSAGEKSSAGIIIYKHRSPTLGRIIRDINVRSNNHYAEHLLRTIGISPEKRFNASTLKEGIENIHRLWRNKGINSNSLFMYDGSGLAPTNALSASFMCDILAYMQTKSKHAQTFFNSFPIAGKEGTVRNFLKGSSLEGKVFVKSGSIANVQCFAGYYMDGQKKYTFTIMVNNFEGTNRQTIRAIEQLLLNTLK